MRKWILFLWAVIFLAAMFMPIHSQKKEGEKWAILVGIDVYDSGEITALSCAVADIKAMRQTLIAHAGYRPENVLVFTSDEKGDKAPTKCNIILGIKYIANHADANDSFLFHFSGHGMVEEGKGYLLTAEADPRDMDTLEITGFKLEDLSRLIGRIPAQKTLLILDACKNDPEKGKGSADNVLTDAFSRGVQFVRRPGMEAQFSEIAAVLFACKTGERSYEWPEKNMGFFTYFLISGLQGEAALPDGRITLQSLIAYLETKVPDACERTKGKHQVPSIRCEGTGMDTWCLSGKGTSTASHPFSPAGAGNSSGVVSGPGTLSVKTLPEGATIFIDGKKKGFSPLIIQDIPQGKCLIRAEAGEDYEYTAVAADVKGGELKEINLALKAKPGYLTIKSVPPLAEAYVDNEFKGELPESGLALGPVEPGTHNVLVRKNGYEDFRESVPVAMRECKVLTCTLIPERSASLVVKTIPQGAIVLIDKKPQGLASETGLTIPSLSWGAHTITAAMDGYEESSKTINLERNENKAVTMALVWNSEIVIKTDPPGAKVIVNGKEQGLTSPEGLRIKGLQEGNHALVLKKEGYEEIRQDIAVSPRSKGAFEFRLGNGALGYFPIEEGNEWEEASESDTTYGRQKTHAVSTSNKRIIGRAHHNGRECIVMLLTVATKIEGISTSSSSRQFFSIDAQGLRDEGTESDGGSGVTINQTPIPYMLKAPYVPGGAWDADCVSTYSGFLSDKKFEGRGSYKGKTTIIGTEEITVPCGTFKCLKVRSESSNDISVTNIRTTSQATTVTWYAPGVGPVMSQMRLKTSKGVTVETTSKVTRCIVNGNRYPQ